VVNPRFALTYGEKGKEAEPESTCDLPAEGFSSGKIFMGQV
jgi:hypothetical protein